MTETLPRHLRESNVRLDMMVGRKLSAMELPDAKLFVSSWPKRTTRTKAWSHS